VLRDVLGFPAAEAAGILGTTQAAVNSTLIRARAGLRPDTDPHDVPLPRSAAEAAVVERFVDALERLDLDRLVALLTDDARLAMPPEAVELRGPLAIAAFHRELPYWGQDVKLVPTRANNQPAFAYYLADPCAPVWRASGLVVLTLRGNRVCGLTRFGAGGFLARFGLPRTQETDRHRRTGQRPRADHIGGSQPIPDARDATADIGAADHNGGYARGSPGQQRSPTVVTSEPYVRAKRRLGASISLVGSEMDHTQIGQLWVRWCDVAVWLCR
jgi:hypothetical protein